MKRLFVRQSVIRAGSAYRARSRSSSAVKLEKLVSRSSLAFPSNSLAHSDGLYNKRSHTTIITILEITSGKTSFDTWGSDIDTALTYIYTHINAYTIKHTCTHSFIHTYIHTYIHTHTHTHTVAY